MTEGTPLKGAPIAAAAPAASGLSATETPNGRRTPDSALLECEGLAVARGTELLLADFSFRVSQARAALVGDFDALFEVLCKSASIRNGRLLAHGQDAADQVTRGEIGLVLRDSWRQPRWTARELLTTSAWLQGMPKSDAEKQSQLLLERLGLVALAQLRLGFLGHAHKKALEVARALVTSPKLLVMQAPFTGLTSSECQWLMSLVNVASEGRGLVVSFDGTLLEGRDLVCGFPEVVLVRRGQLLAVGPPERVLGGGDAYLVSVTRGARRLSEALASLGCRVTPENPDDTSPLQLLVKGESRELPMLVARAATEQQVPVIELVPLTP